MLSMVIQQHSAYSSLIGRSPPEPEQQHNWQLNEPTLAAESGGIFLFRLLAAWTKLQTGCRGHCPATSHMTMGRCPSTFTKSVQKKRWTKNFLGKIIKHKILEAVDRSRSQIAILSGSRSHLQTVVLWPCSSASSCRTVDQHDQPTVTGTVPRCSKNSPRPVVFYIWKWYHISDISLFIYPYGSMATVWEGTANPPNYSKLYPSPTSWEGTTGSIGYIYIYYGTIWKITRNSDVPMTFTAPNGNGNGRLQGCERGGTPRRRGATASQSASSDVTPHETFG